MTLVLPQNLLAHEDTAIPGRVVRSDPTAADLAANVPGRLLSVDITRANFGQTTTHGIDFSVEGQIATAFGSINPRLDLTSTRSFQYSDLPSSDAPLKQRAGVASEQGTITSERAVASLTCDCYGVRASLFARYHSSYKDYTATFGRVTGRRIPSQTIFNANVVKKVGKHVTLTLGVNNVLDSGAPFAEVNDDVGFDVSQGDLIGRFWNLGISGSM